MEGDDDIGILPHPPPLWDTVRAILDGGSSCFGPPPQGTGIMPPENKRIAPSANKGFSLNLTFVYEAAKGEDKTPATPLSYRTLVFPTFRTNLPPCMCSFCTVDGRWLSRVKIFSVFFLLKFLVLLILFK